LRLLGLSICEHIRSFIAEIASVAPAADALMTALWERVGDDPDAVEVDVDALELAIAEHMDEGVADDLAAFGLQRNAGLGFCLALWREWTISGDAGSLVRLARSAVGEFTELAWVESAEAAEVLALAAFPGRNSGVDVRQLRERAEAHGREMARVARAQLRD